MLCALSSGAYAGNSVDLKVTGKLMNGSCTPSLENDGVVDFGHIALGNLSKTETNQLGHKTQTLTVTCTTEMMVGLKAIDNRTDSEIPTGMIMDINPDGFDHDISTDAMGLGKTAAGVNIGAYMIAIDENNVMSDGVKADLIRSDHGAAFTRYSYGILNWADERTLSAAAVGELTPKAAKVTVYPLWVTAIIQGTDTLALTDNTNLDGSATISLVYL